VSFAPGDLIGQRYEQHLSEACSKLLPAGVSGGNLTNSERHKLHQAQKAASLMMQSDIGDDAWRRWRDSQAQFGAPELHPSPDVPGRTERVRRSATGTLRVNLVAKSP